MRGYIDRARKFVILKNISIVRSLYCDVKLKLYYNVLGTTDSVGSQHRHRDEDLRLRLRSPRSLHNINIFILHDLTWIRSGQWRSPDCCLLEENAHHTSHSRKI